MDIHCIGTYNIIALTHCSLRYHTISLPNDNILDNSKFKTFAGDNLTLYHTIPTFNDLEEETFGKHCGEKEKMLVTSIFFFSHNVFYHPQHKFQLFFFSSANALNLDHSKVLSFGKELKVVENDEKCT